MSTAVEALSCQACLRELPRTRSKYCSDACRASAEHRRRVFLLAGLIEQAGDVRRAEAMRASNDRALQRRRERAAREAEGLET
jgi:hypothetical protein